MSRSRTLILAGVLVLSTGPTATFASAADEPVDTVLLKNGGQLRGVVLQQSPSGVTIRLADVTTRRLKASQVMGVEYDEAPAAPAPQALTVPPAPPAAETPTTAAPIPAEPSSGQVDGGQQIRLRGIEIGVSGFETSAFGNAQSGQPIDSAFGAVYGFGVDLGYRINNHFYAGAFGAGACFACGIGTGQVGGVVRAHLRPTAVLDPWLGLGLSYETSGATAGGGYEGWNGHLQGGLDIKPVPAYAIDPFVDVSVGEYTSGDSGLAQAAIHGWFVAGVRTSFDIRF